MSNKNQTYNLLMKSYEYARKGDTTEAISYLDRFYQKATPEIIADQKVNELLKDKSMQRVVGEREKKIRQLQEEASQGKKMELPKCDIEINRIIHDFVNRVMFGMKNPNFFHIPYDPRINLEKCSGSKCQFAFWKLIRANIFPADYYPGITGNFYFSCTQAQNCKALNE